jgi:hypothetical protein
MESENSEIALNLPQQQIIECCMTVSCAVGPEGMSCHLFLIRNCFLKSTTEELLYRKVAVPV